MMEDVTFKEKTEATSMRKTFQIAWTESIKTTEIGSYKEPKKV